ncbi:acyltransferase family protein [Paenibacillus sp. MCAF20]
MSAIGSAVKKRERAIDLFKGLLVLGMVYCHTLQFFSDGELYPNGRPFIEIINLITFSGFVFSFGYVSQLAYYSKPFRQAAPRMLVAAVKTLAAFYVSGMAFRVFIDGREASWSTLKPILLIRDMPGWSEFLISFTYLMIIGLALFVPLRWLASRKAIGFGISGLMLVFTFIPYGSIHVMQLGPLIGTRDFASFPVLQYLPYYIIGILFAKHRITWDWRVFVAALIATGGFVWRWLSVDGQPLPERFPPSVWWIAGPALLMYGYYGLARLMERYPFPFTLFEAMGRNVLSYLVMSNVLIFALKSSQQQKLLVGAGEGFWLACVIVAIVTFCVWIITKPPQSKRSQPSSTTTTT